jgi:hypothetical protein
MKKLATAFASLGLLATLAAPAGAAARTEASGPRRDPSRCYGHHSHNRSDYCTDERHPQHDGRGSLLF